MEPFSGITYPQRVLVQVGGLSFHHLNGHDSQWPNVDFGPVGLPGHHLRSHPVGRAHHGAALALLRSDLSAEAEVGCGDMKEEGQRTAGGFNRLLRGDDSGRDSLSLTEPSIPSNTLSLLMSLWMTWLAWRKSRACKHCRKWRQWENVAEPFNHQII